MHEQLEQILWTVSGMFQDILALCLAAALILLIPESSAFPVLHMTGGSAISFANTFRFPTVPLREGRRHIHTLEHLENITTPLSRVPYFDIVRVAQPQRYGDHVSVCVHSKVKGYPQTIYMLASPDTPSSATFMCVQDGAQRAMVQLCASRLAGEPKGHCLTVNCTYFTGPRVFDRDMEPVLRFLRFFEKRMRWQIQDAGLPSRGEQRANLLWYRRMVLGLDASETASDWAPQD